MAIKKLPIKYDLTIRKGRDFEFRYRLTDKASGAPVDMTGFVIAAQLRPAPGSATLLADFAVDTSQLASGEVAISLDDTTTAALEAGTAYYDIKVTDNAGKDRDHFYGQVTITETVTA